jgi:hypothetical protein
MTLRFVTASALDDFSTGILSSTHMLSPHSSIANSVFSKINLLAMAYSHCMLHQAIKGQTYKGIAVNMTGHVKKEEQRKYRRRHLETMAALCHSKARIKPESKRGNGQSYLRIHKKAWR